MGKLRQKRIGRSSGGGGGGAATVLYYSVSKAQLDTLITNSGLASGATYIITDRGDLGLVFTAVSPNEIAVCGTRFMLCPSTYQAITDGSGNVWIGVWNLTKSVAVNRLAIWGGLVWKNKTGAIGTSVDDITLDSTNWALISKSTYSNNEYTAMEFGINYDYANDWISKQWDINGNVLGLPFAESGTALKDYCSISDWNLGTLIPFYNNTCYAVFNNANSTIGIFGNSNQGTIKKNYNTKGIYLNSNIQAKGINSDIYENINTGDINGNSNAGSIYKNTGSSDIDGNTNIGDIHENNCGAIYGNSNTGEIGGNLNTGAISYNAIPVAISYLPNTVGDYTYNHNDNSFDINISSFTTTVGFKQLFNAILSSGAVITGLSVKGVALTESGTDKALLAIGIETDQESYLPASHLSVLNNGVSINTISSPTTTTFRRIILTPTVANITGGSLRIRVQIL